MGIDSLTSILEKLTRLKPSMIIEINKILSHVMGSSDFFLKFLKINKKTFQTISRSTSKTTENHTKFGRNSSSPKKFSTYINTFTDCIATKATVEG